MPDKNWGDPAPKRERRPVGSGAPDLKHSNNNSALLPLVEARLQEQRRQRRERLARRLHQLGGRASAEFIAEIAERYGEAVDDRLAEYVARLTPELLQASGGDVFPTPPLRIVGGGP